MNARGRPYNLPVHAGTQAGEIAADGALTRVPLVTVYLTERCNSRCISCDYWRNGRNDVSVETVANWIPELRRLGTQVVQVSGGEPLLNPRWMEIAALLRDAGFRLWLLTAGLALAKHAQQVMHQFETATVSLDGADAETYLAIRGLDAFDQVCKGIRSVAVGGLPTSIRVTVQRNNFRQLPALVDLAKELGVRQISFLAADVSNTHAFGRSGDISREVALQADDLPYFEAVLDSLERDQAEAYRSGFIAESPQKMRRILHYYAAICGIGAFPAVRCNAPEFSAVISATGQVNPCFFISGPRVAGPDHGLVTALNGNDMYLLREEIRTARRAECVTCVCSMWRNPTDFATWRVPSAGQA
jgi:Fe-coproporphyrin III synthase